MKPLTILTACIIVLFGSLLKAQPEPTHDANNKPVWTKDNIWCKNMELIKSVKTPSIDGTTGGGVGEYFQMFDDVGHSKTYLLGTSGQYELALN